MDQRFIARYIFVLGLLIFGGVAAQRISKVYLPTWSFPELVVDIRLSEATEVGQFTRTWIQPLESAIRSTGDVIGMAGEVEALGGYLRVRFRAGTDIERKAARLESELASLRRQQQSGTSLQVWPVGQRAGDNAAIVWLPQGLSSGRDIQGLVEALRALPEVRTVTVAGRGSREIRIRHQRFGVDSSQASASLLRRLGREHLGQLHTKGSRLPVLTAGSSKTAFGDIPVAYLGSVLPLGKRADISLEEAEAPWLAHFQGEPGLVLLVARELDTSPLDLEKSLKKTLKAFGVGASAQFLINEAEPLKLLLRRFLWGLAVASVLGFLAVLVLGGSFRTALNQGLVLPLALGASLNLLWLNGIGLDLTTLPLLMVALGSALWLFALRQGGGGMASSVTAVVVAMVFPITVAIIGGRLSSLLVGPAWTFFLAVVASTVSLWILPCTPLKANPSQRHNLQRHSQPLRWTLRNSWTVILGGLTLTALLLVLAGRALAPRQGDLSPGLGDLSVSLRFPAGASLAQAEAQVQAIEDHLSSLEAVAEHWSVFQRRGGSIGVSLASDQRSASQIRAMVTRLQLELGEKGVSARVVPMSGGNRQNEEPIRFTENIEDQPEVDRQATYYRFLLRGTNLENLLKAHRRVTDRLVQMKHEIVTHLILSDWGEPTTQLALIPRAGISREQTEKALFTLHQRAGTPGTVVLSAERNLRLKVLSQEAPAEIDAVPARSVLLGLQPTATEPLATEPHFELRESSVSPSLKRQGGRFVLPVTVRLRGQVETLRQNNRAGVNRVLRTLPLPSGVDLERPELNPYVWQKERLRLLAIAGALPLLLLAIAVGKLNAFYSAFATAIPALLAIAMTTPWILAAKGAVDEMTLMGLVAALTGSFPVALGVAAALQIPIRKPLAGGKAFRWLARRWTSIGIAALVFGTLLIVPGLGLEPDPYPWVLPLRVAAILGLALVASCWLFMPAVLLTGARLRGRDRAKQKQLAVPPAWREPAEKELHLVVRSLTKTYGNGHQALHGVNFALTPGIVGLLGPNGAGKTTLLRTLCGLLEPTRGQVMFHGVPIGPENLPEYRKRVGFLPQNFNAYLGFTAAEFLDYWALEKGIFDPKARLLETERLLEMVGLEDTAKRKVRDFSGGMRRRIGIARALLGDPPVVIVDEPTTGLDVESRNRLREALLTAAGERIIIFSTHIASDIAAAASRILLLHQGRLLFDGSVEGLIQNAQGRVFETLVRDQEMRSFSNRYRVTTRVRTLAGVRVRAVTFGDQEVGGDPVVPNLEEAYLALIGGQEQPQSNLTKARHGSLLDLEAWRS